jgi:hypothetical protein
VSKHLARACHLIFRRADDNKVKALALNRTRAWTGEPTEFEEFCDRAPRAILKIEFSHRIDLIDLASMRFLR